MNKIIYLLFFLLLTPAAKAQTTLACQPTLTTGFEWKSSRWQSTGFHKPPPFFLRINNDGKIEPSSLSKLQMYAGDVQCKVFNSPSSGKRVSCTDFDGTLINLNLRTYEGAFTWSAGAHQQVTNGYRDTISVSTFVCQAM